MHFASRYLRALVFGLVALGLVIPAWAAQPCHCAEKGCCSVSSSVDAAGTLPPCCAARLAKEQAADPCVADHPVGCPCCSEAPDPATPAPKPNNTPSDQESSSTALVADVPWSISPSASAYLARSMRSPAGHSDVRLHALYRVWLN